MNNFLIPWMSYSGIINTTSPHGIILSLIMGLIQLIRIIIPFLKLNQTWDDMGLVIQSMLSHEPNAHGINLSVKCKINSVS